MGLFVCDVCNVIENTALGTFWGRNSDNWSDESLKGKALCSECTPKFYKDGSAVPKGMVWHGRFEKKQATEECLFEIGLFQFNYLGKFEYLKE